MAGQDGCVVPSEIGAIRRLRALVAIGWTTADLAQRLGVEEADLASALAAGIVSSRILRARAAQVYALIEMTVGRSEPAREQARARGRAPPLAWDDESIDDPATEPQGVRPRWSPKVTVDELADLAGLGLTRAEAALRLGVTRQAVAVTLQRHDGATVDEALTHNEESRLVA